jgi:hypothetical protein
MRTFLRAGSALLAAAGLALAVGVAPAGASTKQLYLAGYHFNAPKGSTLTVRADITVPNSSCASGDYVYSPQVVVRYYVGTGLKVASVLLGLGCAFGSAVPGAPVLAVDGHVKNVTHLLSVGETVGVVITIKRSRASATLVFSRHSSATETGPGGKSKDVQYSVALPKPPRYRPVRFADCTANGRRLSSFRPGSWEGINPHGKVLGKVSRISRGTSFSVSS